MLLELQSGPGELAPGPHHSSLSERSSTTQIGINGRERKGGVLKRRMPAPAHKLANGNLEGAGPRNLHFTSSQPVQR